MNRGTLIYVAVALVTAAGAWSVQPKPLPPATYEDTGEPLFPEFTDPTAATSLEVIGWDEDAARVVTFKVEQKGGVWVIPSHNDYPADGTARMGEAAASFVDVKKDIYLGDNPEDHAKFGVLDPQGDKGEGDEKGKRIVLTDGSGKKLVDIIVGKAVPDKANQYYVRFPAAEGDDQGSLSKRVYASNIDLNITTKFEDWIEKDLLHVKRDEIVTVVSDPYQVDERAHQVVRKDPLAVHVDAKAASPSSADWLPAEGVKVPAGKAIDSFKVRQIATAIANLKIVGVRPRPPMERLTHAEIQSKGFFATPDGKLFGNEGEVSIVTKDGLRYTLLFGEVTYESGLALTAGTSDPAGSEPESEDEANAGDDTKTASRYMWVDVRYDPNLDQTLAETPTEGEAAESEPNEADEAKKAAGEARAEKLARRFSKWYYVISDSSFKQIHKEHTELFKDAPADKDK